ncbi:MAG: NTP transferase domain-containing protein [Oscillospiraceae bacterium]|nr:NTP transferase domain-containing protein [Oscillospiraceae bacterium]
MSDIIDDMPECGEAGCRLSPCPPSLTAELIKKHCPRPLSILDMGCGNGETLEYLSAALPDARLFGIDISEKAVSALGERLPGAFLYAGGAEKTPFPDGCFDVIVCECVFSLLDNPLSSAEEIKRLLAPEGILIAGDLYTKNSESLLRDRENGVRNVYTARDLEGFFSETGLREISYEDKTESLLSFAAEIIMSGSGALSCETLALLRRARAGYGVWVFRKEAPLPLMGLVLCAGLSSRMGRFKAFLPVKGESMLRRNVSLLHNAGAERVLVVTGHRANDVREHLKDIPYVVFAHNPDYAETGMLESVKLALSVLKDRCKRLLITPVDVPAVSPAAAVAVAGVSSDFARPLYKGQPGHPVGLSQEAFDRILSYNGPGGLGGAVSAQGISVSDVPVEDKFVLLDADTPEAYDKLIKEFE